jgi:hypothetical protein
MSWIIKGQLLVNRMTYIISIFQDAGQRSIGQALCTIDSKHGLILLRILEGVIKLIYLKDLSSKESSSKNLESFNIKFVYTFEIVIV